MTCSSAPYRGTAFSMDFHQTFNAYLQMWLQS